MDPHGPGSGLSIIALEKVVIGLKRANFLNSSMFSGSSSSYNLLVILASMGSPGPGTIGVTCSAPKVMESKQDPSFAEFTNGGHEARFEEGTIYIK